MENNKKLTTLNIVGIFLIVVFLPIIVLNLTIILKGLINPEEVPMILGHSPLLIDSDSMTIDPGSNFGGAFNKGDMIMIQEVEVSKLQKGDIITYYELDAQGNKIKNKDGSISIISHRISDINENGEFIVVGDYTHSEDANPVKHDQVIGKYTGFRIPNGGKIANFFRTPGGLIVLVGVPLLVIFGIDFFQKSKEQKNNDSERAELEAELAKLRAEKEQLTQETKEEVKEESSQDSKAE